MSGVIDEDGTQWEHCGECHKFIKIQNLGYEKLNGRYTRQLCVGCASKLIRNNICAFQNIIPGDNWIETLT